MKDIYLLDVYENCVNGFATYKKEFISCLESCPNFRLNHVITGFPSDEFTICQEGKIRVICIPTIKERQYYNCITGVLLQLYISNSSNTIFFQNFSPSSHFVIMLKENFPLCKIVYVIHDFIWATYLMGNITKFKSIINQEEENENAVLVRKVFEDGLNTSRIVDKMVCLSDDTYELMKTFYQVDVTKLTKIPNGLNDERSQQNFALKKMKEDYNLSPDCKIILYIGRVTKQKGCIDLIKCFRSVVATFPNCKLVIAGNIDSSIIAQIDNKIRLNIILLGVLDKTQIHEWYRIADIGVLPSYYEQCSYVGIEMKMFGLPVVASDAFGVKNMFNSENAMVAYLENNNSNNFQKQLSGAIIEMLTLDNKERNIYRTKSRDSYIRSYSSSLMATNYKFLIENL